MLMKKLDIKEIRKEKLERREDEKNVLFELYNRNKKEKILCLVCLEK